MKRYHKNKKNKSIKSSRKASLRRIKKYSVPVKTDAKDIVWPIPMIKKLSFFNENIEFCVASNTTFIDPEKAPDNL